jgi:hypothetical protein
VTAQLTKDFMDKVMKGDIVQIRREQEKVGIPISYLIDEKSKHNAVFYATLIKDEQACLKVIDYLLSQGLDCTQTDELNQTALFYSAREGKVDVTAFLCR